MEKLGRKAQWFLPILFASLASGCCTIVQTERVIGNIDTTFVAVEEPERAYQIGSNVFVEFHLREYKDHYRILGEDIHGARFTPVGKALTNRVFMACPDGIVDATQVFGQVVKIMYGQNNFVTLNDSELLNAPVICVNRLGGNCRRAYHYPGHLNIAHGYPVVVDQKRGIFNYVLIPFTFPAFLLDVSVTLAAVPVYVAMLPITVPIGLICDRAKEQPTNEHQKE